MNTDLKPKLSKQQKKVIKDLQNDCCLTTSSEFKGAWVGNSQGQYHIGTRLFFNLVDKGFIYQEFSPPYDYILTKLGKDYNDD